MSLSFLKNDKKKNTYEYLDAYRIDRFRSLHLYISLVYRQFGLLILFESLRINSIPLIDHERIVSYI